MNKQIYYRRKDKSIVIEGKAKGKSILIWTLPSPEILINLIMEKASYFTQEKKEKISQNLKRLDNRQSKEKKDTNNVRTINITRTPNLDAKIDYSQLNELLEND